VPVGNAVLSSKQATSLNVVLKNSLFVFKSSHVSFLAGWFILLVSARTLLRRVAVVKETSKQQLVDALRQLRQHTESHDYGVRTFTAFGQ